MARLKCPRCGHVWEYKGKGLYATCPRCYRKVSVEKHRFNEEEGTKSSSGGV